MKANTKNMLKYVERNIIEFTSALFGTKLLTFVLQDINIEQETNDRNDCSIFLFIYFVH